MENEKPLVSVIVPCFNQAKYLSEALESVFSQTYQNWECIIVNDGSPDSTKEVAEGWLKKDNRFKYLEQGNKGPSAARNAGIKIANGTYILPLDADDRISEDYLELAVKEFLVDNPPKVVYCRAEFFGEKSGEWNLKPFTLKDLAYENMIFCTAIFKRVDWEVIGGYDEKMKIGWEDWEFWIHLLKNGGVVKKINKVCFFYRINQSSRNKNILELQAKILQDYVNIKHADFYIRMFGNFWDNQRRFFNLMESLKSKKHAVNLLTKRFIGFKVFTSFKLPTDE